MSHRPRSFIMIGMRLPKDEKYNLPYENKRYIIKMDDDEFTLEDCDKETALRYVATSLEKDEDCDSEGFIGKVLVKCGDQCEDDYFNPDGELFDIDTLKSYKKEVEEEIKFVFGDVPNPVKLVVWTRWG